MRTYTSRMESLKIEALTAVNNHVAGSVTLEDGNRAFDLDDAWLIVGKPNTAISECPCIRDKREKSNAYDSPLMDLDAEWLFGIVDKILFKK